MKKLFAVATFCFLWPLALSLAAQTFEIQGQSENSPLPGSKSPQGQSSKTPAGTDGIGWGSSIEVGRLSRAAEQALARGKAAEAADYASRALKAAPENGRLWFLLGYAARLAGRYQQSIDAYQHGLSKDPGSIEGMSGLAQTYIRLGRPDEAGKLLMRVIAANPRRPVELAMAGELFLHTGEMQRGLDLLQRSEALQPNAHTEVLLATAYMKSKQPQKAMELLDRARRRSGNNRDVARAVANYHRETGDYKAAIQTLQQVSPKSPDILAELGFTYTLAGNRKEAAAVYAQAAAAAPNEVKLQLSAAESQVRLGNRDSARKYLSRAELLDANHYRLHAIRADLARSDKRPAEAIREYQQALASLPQAGAPEGVLYPIQLRLWLTEQYREARDDESARAQAAKAKSEIAQLDIQGAQRPEFLRLRASIEATGGDYARAESDLQEALRIDPENVATLIQYAAMAWRNQRPDDARRLYHTALEKEPNNRFALESVGYLAREQGDNRTAEDFFQKLRTAYPDDFVAYMALGDLYTAQRRFQDAQESYQKAHHYAPSNPQIVAGGANAAIEAHQFDLAATWLDRAQGSMRDDPRIMREQMRYLFHQGKFLESAQLGRKVLEKLPNDREGSVYLAYDLYNLGRYDDALAVARKYQQTLPREPNFPLLAGHAEKQSQLLAEAIDDYTRSIEIDPSIDQAWINRGYVLNDMQNAEQAAQDFQHVLKTAPNNGVARLGLAFSYLQLHKGKLALAEADAAQLLIGESGSTHLARAGAYRQMRLLPEAEKEYRAALKYAPNDLTLRLALADTQYYLKRYSDSIDTLNEALSLAPDNASIYAKLAHAHARLHNRDMTLRYVKAAEQQEPDASAVLLDSGDALLIVGEESAAMERFERALQAPDANRVDARLLIAKLMTRQGHWDEARQQVSLAFAESRIGEASPVTTDNLIEAANIFLSMHEFDLAEKYFRKAQDAGAADQVIAIGLANTYLAQGDPQRAQVQLGSLGNAGDSSGDYDYNMAMAGVYRERRDNLRALDMFARANMLAGPDDPASVGLQEAAAEEGMRINRRLSASTSLNIAPIFDDSTIYTTYSRLNRGSGLVAPHSLVETRWRDSFRVRQGDLPPITGFFELRNARGSSSVPSLFRFVPLDTYDYTFNGGINPVLHFGRNYLAFNPGLSFTFRRDKDSPVPLNQNLFRQSVYVQSSSFWNWISVRGSAMHEAGPFTEQNLSSRDLAANLEFQVGRPWGNTALLTGYKVRDLRFSPRQQEWFQTSTYVGIQRKLGKKVTAAVLGEYVRAWAVLDNSFGAAQMLRPAFQIDYRPNRRWRFNGNFAYSRGQGDHVYDNMQSGFYISYVRVLRRNADNGNGEVPVEYPLRFSFGLEQQNFYNYAGPGQAQLRPVFRLTLF